VVRKLSSSGTATSQPSAWRSHSAVISIAAPFKKLLP
jgi:hypothetical protein